MRKGGFTLIELLIVIAIITVLAGAMVPMFRTTRKEAQDAKVRAELDAIKTAAIMYHQDIGSWPPTGTTGDDLITDVAPTDPNWKGPYLDEWRNDPWDSPYELAGSTGNSLVARSSGSGTNIDLIVTPSYY